MIRLGDVLVRFGGTVALDLEALDLAPGERLGVTGPNGSGKSTLLRVLAGLLRPTSGRLEGLPAPGRATLVHQRPWLFHGTPRSNVALALRLARRDPAEALGWLERLGAGAYAARDVAGLSGGERRRVALARALSVRPALLLLDEPLADLDEEGGRLLRGALADYAGTLVIAAPTLPADLTSRTTALASRR